MPPTLRARNRRKVGVLGVFSSVLHSVLAVLIQTPADEREVSIFSGYLLDFRPNAQTPRAGTSIRPSLNTSTLGARIRSKSFLPCQLSPIPRGIFIRRASSRFAKQHGQSRTLADCVTDSRPLVFRSFSEQIM